MVLYSTANRANQVALEEAVFNALPTDGGLYMPVDIPKMDDEFIQYIEKYSFKDIAFRVARRLLKGYIPENELAKIIEQTITFSAPVVMHNDKIGTLELWHGPSLAFKDFGARFMAALMSYFNRNKTREVTILVATSGDTGGAVAAGFYNIPGTEVRILYPSGKVSPLQEKQLTTWKGNITAYEVDGSFDDCQAMVKAAFLDTDFANKYQLSSANSINIARLIPQMFYYFEAYKQVKSFDKPLVVAVPSGNFGNLTAGLMAQKMGLPIDHFIAATNINKVVPDYLKSGVYEPKASIQTISNAMDVGDPSNFQRILDLYNGNIEIIRSHLSGHSLTDKEDRKVMKYIYEQFNYMADPHGAIGFDAVRSYLEQHPKHIGLYLETAHPAKFLSVMEETLDASVHIPEKLMELSKKEKKSIRIKGTIEALKAAMI